MSTVLTPIATTPTAPTTRPMVFCALEGWGSPAGGAVVVAAVVAIAGVVAALAGATVVLAPVAAIGLLDEPSSNVGTLTVTLAASATSMLTIHVFLPGRLTS